MRLTHPDYIRLVIEAYKKKRGSIELSPLLAKSTPANLKKECLNVYRERYHQRDDHTLRTFFGPAEHGKHFLKLIQGLETDRFKPLDNYLKEHTEKTEDKNVELLAWMIDFQHRPYVFDKHVLLNDEELCLIGQYKNDTQKKENGAISKDEGLQTKRVESGVLLKKEPEEEPVENNVTASMPLNIISKDNKEKNAFTRAVIIFLLLIICTGGIYMIWQEERAKQLFFGNTNNDCMYWKGDRYAAIPCNEKRSDLFKFPMDLEKVKNFKRITNEDTITEKSIGVIYCISINGKPEYYTAGGNHPIYVTRRLKALSRYMFDKYLRKKDVPRKDSVSK